MLNTVIKALDDKVDQYTSYTYAMAVRIVREVQLLVNTTDKVAEDYCAKIRSHPGVGNKIRINSIGSAEDLERLMENLAYRAYTLESPVMNRQYILYVTSKPDEIFRIEFNRFRSCFMELEYDLLYLSLLDPKIPPVKGFMRCLNTSPMDVYTGRVLVLDAGISNGILLFAKNSFTKDDKWYRLRTKEFSSVKEEICEQIYRELQPQLMGETPDVIRNKLNGMQAKYKPVLEDLQGRERDYPTARNLPFTGYDQLRSQLAGVFSGWSPGGQHRDTGLSILQALSILFGTENNTCVPERLRSELGNNTVAEICRKTVSDLQTELKDYLFNTFTFRDICSQSGIAVWTSEETARLQMAANQMEERIKRYISQTQYTAASLSPTALFQGLEEYFSGWEEYIAICFWREWWRSITDFVTLIAGQSAKEFSALSDICDWVKETIDYSNIRLRKGGSLYSVARVMDRIRGASALRTYTTDDLDKLMEREGKRIIYSRGIRGDGITPRMYLLANYQVVGNNRMETPVKKRIYDLNWGVQPVSYVPNSLVYIIRINMILQDEVGDDQI